MRENDMEVNLLNLSMDPGLRHLISYYNVNIQDQVRRQYLQNGPCQPKTHNFPLRHFGKQSQRFNPAWFDKYGNWLEYSIAKDVAFCLCCYLFNLGIGEQEGGESFTKHGFTNWKQPERLRVYISFTIRTCISRHNESEESSNRGNFLELLKFLTDHEDIKAVTLKNAPSFFKVTCLHTKKDIQINVVLQYVNTSGQVVERFIGIEQVVSTTTKSLKEVIDRLFF
ncbi:hypothetical protein CISIN_1g037172mg [Citrus sinensis]|uniref:TTF-type domain-containing protein n=1 Tax=Citrus sinensis TaxID=2711 RepID=A0A067DTK6_CITSI|nr:hypothetical protein CISIN_1g037172mg [Citrus sinensis]